LIFIDKPDFVIRKAMGRFSWDAEEALNITEILADEGEPHIGVGALVVACDRPPG
jgi:hypothetical protein